MTTTQHQGFFALPAELRLEVYGRLLASSIAEGYPCCARGLYSSCIKNHDEMDECVEKVLPIIKLQNHWLRNSPSVRPLHVYLPSTYESTGPVKDLTLLIPVSMEINSGKHPIDLGDLASILSYVSRLQLSTFTLSFYQPGPHRDVPWHASIIIASHLLYRIPIILETEHSYLRGIDRLMIELGTLGAPPLSIGDFGKGDMYQIFKLCYCFSRKQIWWLGIGGTAPNLRWTLCLDLKQGLKPPVNALGRRWTLGPHALDEWDKENPDA